MSGSSTPPHPTQMLLVTIPEWGHLSPFLHVADSIQRTWDTSSRGKLQLSIASMDQVCAVTCCALAAQVSLPSAASMLHTQLPRLFQVRSKVEARGINFVSIGAWETKEEQEEYARCSR